MQARLVDQKAALDVSQSKLDSSLAEEREMRRADELLERQQNWPLELARILEQSRGTERQTRRFDSYRSLWSKLRPLASYDDSVINQETSARLLADLRNWYFDDGGGLVATPWVREMYLAVQDLLRYTATTGNWVARRTDGARQLFIERLEKRGGLARARAFREAIREHDLLEGRPPADSKELAAGGRADMRSVCEQWG